MSEINLLAKKKNPLTSKKKILSTLRLAAVVLLFSVSFSSIALFLLTLTSPLASLNRKEDDLLKGISVYDTRIQKSMLLADRLTQISTIIEKRTQYNVYIDLLLEDLPENILVDSLTVVEKNEGDIRLSLSSVSLSSLDEFLVAFVKRAEKQEISDNVFLDTVLYNTERNVYSIAILLEQ